MYESAHGYGRSEFQDGLRRLGGDLIDWLRTRPTEQWLMFVAGVALGLWIG